MNKKTFENIMAGDEFDNKLFWDVYIGLRDGKLGDSITLDAFISSIEAEDVEELNSEYYGEYELAELLPLDAWIKLLEYAFDYFEYGYDKETVILACFLSGEEKEKILPEELKSYGYQTVEYGNQEYYVLNNDEAEEKAKECSFLYIDDCILPELPENLRQYFDYDKFAEDAITIDGRGHIIASYDGYEHEIMFNSTWYFIYRIN